MLNATEKDITVKGSGITGINAGYNKANGEVKENAETHVSTITAKDTLATKSGQDTNIIGSKLEGETIKMGRTGGQKEDRRDVPFLTTK